MRERTLVLVKPDGVMKGYAARIIEKYESAGLVVIAEENLQMSRSQARKLYEQHEGKPFFEGLVLAMTSGPSKAVILEGENAIQRVRDMNGATDPREALPGTIRHDFRSAGGPFNTVHASDSHFAAHREIALFLEPERDEPPVRAAR